MGELLRPTHAADGRRLTEDEKREARLLACVDEPSARRVSTEDGSCVFRGWVASSAGRPTKVRVRVGRTESYESVARDRRSDLAKTLAGRFAVSDLNCGFRIAVPVPTRRRPVSVRLELTDGEHMVRSPRYRVRSSARSGRPRADYKSVWNAVAADVNRAKLAVTCYTDENQYRETADLTVSTLCSTVGISPNDVVLEVGCGIGRVGAAVAPLCREWIGVDVSEKMLAHARVRLAEVDNVQFVAVNGWDLEPIGTASIDVAYCTVVFMHLDEWDRFAYVRESFRVLRPGGRIYVDNFNLLSDEGWALFVAESKMYHPLTRPPNISKSSTPQELQTYLERAGFVEVTLSCHGTWVHAWGTKPRDAGENRR